MRPASGLALAALLLLGAASLGQGASPSPETSDGVLRYTFLMEEATLAPDGIPKTVLTNNGELIGPTIRGKPGQEVYVTVINQMSHATTMHWHGLKMKDNFWYDGVPWASQCPIEVGETFIYNFYLEDTPGTHWYHSHAEAQRADGTFGAIVIEEEEESSPGSSSSSPLTRSYDRDEVVNVHDWFHETYEELEHIVVTNPWDFGAGPFFSTATKSVLVNGVCEFTDTDGDFGPANTVYGSKYTFNVDSGERVLYRFYNSASQAFLRMEFEDHIMVIVGKDGNPVQAYAVQRLDINAGERYDVVLHAYKASGTFNFLISPIMRSPCTGVSDGGFGGCQQFVHTLQYTTTGTAGEKIADFDVDFNPRKLKSVNALPDEFKTLYPDATLVFDARFPERPVTGGNAPSFVDANGIPQFGFLTWELNKKISIKMGPQYDAVPVGESHPNDNVFNFPLGTVVDVVFQTFPHFRGSVEQHPWHYHGHAWWVLGWGEGQFDYREHKDLLNFEDPHVADTTTVYGENNPTTGMNFKGPATTSYPDFEDRNSGARGWVLVRMVLDNPGAWIAHCHQEWHTAEGMYVFVTVGTEEDLQKAAPQDEAFSAIGDFPACPAARGAVSQLSESSSGVYSGMAVTDGEKSSATDGEESSSSEWGGSSANDRASERGESFGYLGVDSSSNQGGNSDSGDSSNKLPEEVNLSHDGSSNGANSDFDLGGGPDE